MLLEINSKDNTLIIADNGAGIREDVEPLIFNEFFSLKSDGRGLGLYIVKEILLRVSAEISIIHEEKENSFLGQTSLSNSTTNLNNMEGVILFADDHIESAIFESTLFKQLKEFGKYPVFGVDSLDKARTSIISLNSIKALIIDYSFIETEVLGEEKEQGKICI